MRDGRPMCGWRSWAWEVVARGRGQGEVKARSRRGQGDARSEKSDSSANARWLGKGQGGKALRPDWTLRLGVNIVEAMPWENEHLEGQYI